MVKPTVMQHIVESYKNNGGPFTGLNLILNSYLKQKYNFPILYQNRAPHGINIKLLYDLFKEIKSVKPDILHVRGLQSEGFYGVLAGRIAGCKNIVLSVHGFYSEVVGLNWIMKNIFRHIIEPITLQLANSVYCVCDHATNKAMIKKNVRKLSKTIYNAAPNYSNLNKVEIRSRFRTEQKIDNNTILITIVSRVTIDKGFETLLNSILLLKDEKCIKFVIGGDGPYLDRFKQVIQINEIDNVIFLGKCNNVSDILISSDIFVFPSLHENLSNSLLEACSAGLACIATRVGGNSEIIEDNLSGLLIEVNDPTHLASKIKLLLNNKDLRHKLGENARIRMEQLFSSESTLSSIDNLYYSVLHKNI